MHTLHGQVSFPSFLPDATRGVVRSVDCGDLVNSGVSALVVNIFHLSNNPGSKLLESVGGIHKYMGWNGVIFSDSGGFQLFSMMRESERFGSIRNNGFIYRPNGQGKRLFTPAKSIQQQLRIGSDVIFCLDHCTHPNDSYEEQKRSVNNTIRWAKECREEFDRATDNEKFHGGRPKLFAAVQGGPHLELRRQCVDTLLEIGFDGYGFGGWPIDDSGQLVEMVQMVAELLPPGVPKHGLGIGKPENIVAAAAMGYTTFDSSLPTRDARRQRLYVSNHLSRPLPSDNSFYKYLYIGDDIHMRSDDPIDVDCSCLCCKQYSRAYLHHLFQIKDGLAWRLATIHNLCFMSRLTESIGSCNDH